LSGPVEYPPRQQASARAPESSARGSIETVNGTYRAFGQKLDIERGRLAFDGAIEPGPTR
jgi:autotransporter translocation and assembly factor TamB